MVPFKLPPKLHKQVVAQYTVKDKIVSHYVTRMESVMRGAVDYILNHYLKVGQYAPPTLNEMYGVGEDFYRAVIRAAYHSSQKEAPVSKNAKGTQGLKHLSANQKWTRFTTLDKSQLVIGRIISSDSQLTTLAALPSGMPRTLKGLEKIFRDKRYWPKIMKRNQKLVDRMRKSYLQKLQRKFSAIVPRLDAGELTPDQAKAQMMKAWDASKSRVELIFRTETTTYFGKTQVAFFDKDPEVIGFLFDSVRDTSRTPWCRSRHGLVYRPGTDLLRQNTPSCHWNCRSHLIVLANTPYNRKLLADPQRDPSKRKVVPLPEGWRK